MQRGQKNITLLLWISFLLSFRFYPVVAIIYFSQVTHSYALGGSVFSLVKMAQAICEVPTGMYSDRLGRKACLVIGSVTSVLAVTLYAVGRFYPILVAGALFDGASLALFTGNNDALLYETLAEVGQKESYHEALGRVNSVLNLAGFLSGIIGSIIATWSFPLLLWLSVIPQLLCVVISLYLRESPIIREKPETIFSHLKEAFSLFKTKGQLRHLSLASIIAFGIGEAFFRFQPAFYQTFFPVWATGLMISLNSLISTISFRFSGKLITKLRAINLLLYQEVYSRGIDILALAFPTVLSPFLMAIASIVYGPGEVAKNMLLQQELTDTHRATIASINSLLQSCFYAFVAFLLGSAAGKIGLTKTLLVAQISLFPVFLLYLKVFYTTKRRGDFSPSPQDSGTK